MKIDITTKNAAIFAASIAFVGLMLITATKNFRNFDRTVEARGLAERAVDADLAHWKLTFENTADDLKKLSSQSERDEEKLISFLKAHGVHDDEMEVGPTSITDFLTGGYGAQKGGPRYKSTGQVEIRTERVEVVKGVRAHIKDLQKQGILLSSQEPRYFFTALNKIKPGMLEEATLSAKAAAQKFVEISGAHLGELRSASQGFFSITSTYGEYDNGSDSRKKVRVVTEARFFLK